MMYVLKTYSTEEVIDIVDKLTMGYYTAIGIIVAIVSAVLIFAVWDRKTMKKDIQEEFEAKLEKETEKVKQEMQTKVDGLLEDSKNELTQETEKVKQEMQTKVDELVEISNKTVDEKLKQSSKQMMDMSILIDNKSVLRNKTTFTINMIFDQDISNYKKLLYLNKLASNILEVLNNLEEQQINDSLHEDIFEFFKITVNNVNVLVKEIYSKYDPDKDSTEDREKSKQQIKAINDTIENILDKFKKYPYFRDMVLIELYLDNIDETKLFAGSKQSKPNKTN